LGRKDKVEGVLPAGQGLKVPLQHWLSVALQGTTVMPPPAITQTVRQVPYWGNASQTGAAAGAAAAAAAGEISPTANRG
jgi:hypothetical protein